MAIRLFLLISALATSQVLASKLNVPRVLLPFSDEGTTFILKSDDERGCFQWKSSRPEVSYNPTMLKFLKWVLNTFIYLNIYFSWFQSLLWMKIPPEDARPKQRWLPTPNPGTRSSPSSPPRTSTRPGICWGKTRSCFAVKLLILYTCFVVDATWSLTRFTGCKS